MTTKTNEDWEKKFEEGWARNNPEHPRIAKREAVRQFIKDLLTQKDKETALAVEKERERIWEKLQGHTIREHRSNMTDWIDWNDVCAVFGKETELEKRIKEKEEELAKLKSLTPQ